jgi:hypothetical protein
MLGLGSYHHALRAPHSLTPHQPLDSKQSTFDALRRQIPPDAPGTIGRNAGNMACLDRLAQSVFSGDLVLG